MSQPDLTDELSMADRKPLACYGAMGGALARGLLRRGYTTFRDVTPSQLRMPSQWCDLNSLVGTRTIGVPCYRNCYRTPWDGQGWNGWRTLGTQDVQINRSVLDAGDGPGWRS